MKKISKTKIAATYGLSLYEAAVDKKSVDTVFQDVKKLLEVLNVDVSFVKYMANPLMDTEAKKEVLREIAKKLKLSSEVLGCLEVIDDNSRFANLKLILEEFGHIYYAKHDIVEVGVDTVKNLSSQQDKELKLSLEKLLHKKVLVKYTVAPELLGGLRVKFGSLMIDDSIQNKLNRLEIVMKGRQ